MREKKVTKEILEHVRATIKAHNKDTTDYMAGIKEAGNYLRDNVEKAGILSYVNEGVGSSSTEIGERQLCYDLYDEVNKYEGKTELGGETS